jgi:hypothetical protein
MPLFPSRCNSSVSRVFGDVREKRCTYTREALSGPPQTPFTKFDLLAFSSSQVFFKVLKLGVPALSHFRYGKEQFAVITSARRQRSLESLFSVPLINVD